MNIPDERLNDALDALREHLQGTAHGLATLRETSHNDGQRLGQLTADVETLRQELQGIRQNNSELERSLRTQLAKAQEQLDTHTRTLATFTERTQIQSQETREQLQTLTGLHQQEQSQRENALTTLSQLNERASSLEQQINANQTRVADTLRVDQSRLAALEKWLTTQAEQFGRFDPILRELHGELVSAHQRLAALESAGIAEKQEEYEQRLSKAEQHVHHQSDALGEIQQVLEQLAVQAPATAKRNRQMMGGLAAVGVIIIVLLVILAVG